VPQVECGLRREERHRSVAGDVRCEKLDGHHSRFGEDGLLVGYLETEDFERARSGMATREVNERWQREMGDIFVQPDGVLPDRAMQPLEEVFHL
jgi:L-rhamnose mutarotase